MREPLPGWRELVGAVGSRQELARLCNVKESTIWRWMRGVVVPSLLVQTSVNRICSEHGVPAVFPEAECV
jgi:hypothetical protein